MGLRSERAKPRAGPRVKENGTACIMIYSRDCFEQQRIRLGSGNGMAEFTADITTGTAGVHPLVTQQGTDIAFWNDPERITARVSVITPGERGSTQEATLSLSNIGTQWPQVATHGGGGG